MLRIAVVLLGIILYVAPPIARAEFLDGTKLNAYLQAYDRVANARNTRDDLTQSGLAMGYIAGVADAVSGTAVCTQPNTKIAQLVAVVQKRLREHPDDSNEPADRIVAKALSDAYPCKGK